MKKLVPILASTLLSAALSAQAAPEAGEKSFSLSGTGSSDDSFDSNSFGVSGELGWYQTEHLLWVSARASMARSVKKCPTPGTAPPVALSTCTSARATRALCRCEHRRPLR